MAHFPQRLRIMIVGLKVLKQPLNLHTDTYTFSFKSPVG